VGLVLRLLIVTSSCFDASVCVPFRSSCLNRTVMASSACVVAVLVNVSVSPARNSVVSVSSEKESSTMVAPTRLYQMSVVMPSVMMIPSVTSAGLTYRFCGVVSLMVLSTSVGE